MRLILDILRRENASAASYRQRIPFETDDRTVTAAAALHELNRTLPPDENGTPIMPIRWECSCMQKKCGACAMRIGGVPRLACDTKLTEFEKHGVLTLEPLRKFPVIADLIVDRSIMMENLRMLKAWLSEESVADETVGALTYDAARCLQCGCCLEVCPNFCADGSFFGMSAAVPAARLLSAMSDTQKAAFSCAYRRHIYEGCGKSLACRTICPAGIDIERLLVNSNAAAVWKRRKAFRVRPEEQP